jgi:hypothetical protein
VFLPQYSYTSHADNKGKAATYREILTTAIYEPHTYYDTKAGFTAGPVVDGSLICELRNLPKDNKHYKEFKAEVKAALQCYTPAALLKTKKRGNVTIIEQTGVMQLDFDQGDIQQYDIDELMRAVFSLPFIGYCGRSCSGDGFYALALIAEPEKLSEYAEHCFEVLKDYGIQPDESKGKKVENLRYLSYDTNALIRKNPEPLTIKNFRKKKAVRSRLRVTKNNRRKLTGNKVVDNGLSQIKSATVGTRFTTIQRVAYTLGGLNNSTLLSEIKQTIKVSTQYNGEEDKYCTCAEVCFKAGSENPLKKAA